MGGGGRRATTLTRGRPGNTSSRKNRSFGSKSEDPMAQPQSQSSKEASAPESRSGANLPARRARGAQRTPSGPLSWAAAGPYGLMRRLSEDMDQLFGELTGATG